MVIVGFGQAMAAAAVTLATAKAATIMALAKATLSLTTRRMIRTGVGEKRSRVGMRGCRMTMGIRLTMT